jgi:hypothetical protein
MAVWHLPASQHLRKALPTARRLQSSRHYSIRMSLWLSHSISE